MNPFQSSLGRNVSWFGSLRLMFEELLFAPSSLIEIAGPPLWGLVMGAIFLPVGLVMWIWLIVVRVLAGLCGYLVNNNKED